MNLFEKATDFFKSIMNYFIGIMFVLLKKDKHSFTVITILMISITSKYTGDKTVIPIRSKDFLKKALVSHLEAILVSRIWNSKSL